MPLPTLPLVAANDIERERSWEGISTPHELAVYMSRVLAVNPSAISSLQETIFSDTQPTGEDSKKIWIRTASPIGIGIPVGGEYAMIYQYPVNTPILWTTGVNNIPNYMRQLTTAEMTDYSLTVPESSNIKWVIFNA